MTNTLYSISKNAYLSNIISFKNPSSANGSSKELLREFKNSKTRVKKRKIKRATVQASNRALASSKKRNLSSREKMELKQISRIYHNTYVKMIL